MHTASRYLLALLDLASSLLTVAFLLEVIIVKYRLENLAVVHHAAPPCAILVVPGRAGKGPTRCCIDVGHEARWSRRREDLDDARSEEAAH